MSCLHRRLHCLPDRHRIDVKRASRAIGATHPGVAGWQRRATATAAGALLLAASPALLAATADDTVRVLNRSLYQLVDPTPLASLSPGADARWRIEAATGLGERHQLRLSSATTRLVAPLSMMDSGMPTRYDARATWRYTVMERPGWAWRVGLTAALGDRDMRGLTAERARFGALPLLHVAGEGALARRWLLGFDADGLMTARGRAFELGLRVSYLLAPNFSVIGGYRLSDAAGDGEEAYGNGFANSANVGVRYRF